MNVMRMTTDFVPIDASSDYSETKESNALSYSDTARLAAKALLLGDEGNWVGALHIWNAMLYLDGGNKQAPGWRRRAIREIKKKALFALEEEKREKRRRIPIIGWFFR